MDPQKRVELADVQRAAAAVRDRLRYDLSPATIVRERPWIAWGGLGLTLLGGGYLLLKRRRRPVPTGWLLAGAAAGGLLGSVLYVALAGRNERSERPPRLPAGQLERVSMKRR